MTRIYVAYTLCLLPFWPAIFYRTLLPRGNFGSRPKRGGKCSQRCSARPPVPTPGRKKRATALPRAGARPGPPRAAAPARAGWPAAGAPAVRRPRRRGLARTGAAFGLLALLLLLVVAAVLAEDRSDDAV